jgi:hypothetical protein
MLPQVDGKNMIGELTQLLREVVVLLAGSIGLVNKKHPVIALP